jgi:hypothetical protein
MNTKTAITAFSQSEKLKSGIIWATQIVDMLAEMSQNEKSGAEKSVKALIAMMGYESVIARRSTGDSAWINLEKDLDMALVMINSGVAHEATYHLSRALRQAAGIGSKSMSFLIENGVL